MLSLNNYYTGLSSSSGSIAVVEVVVVAAVYIYIFFHYASFTKMWELFVFCFFKVVNG